MGSAPWDADSVTSASKREVLEWLQEHASESFLQQNNLTGNATSKAKRCKASDLHQAYLSFCASEAKGGSGDGPVSAAPAASSWGGGGGAKGPTTVLEAVRVIKSENPELGAKKFVAEVKARFSCLEASGVKVGAKEVREALKELEGANTGSSAASGDGSSSKPNDNTPRDGMKLDPASMMKVFGVRVIPGKMQGKKKRPDTIEGGNNRYKLVSKNWVRQLGPDGAKIEIKMQSKSDESEMWAFHLPVQVNVLLDPFSPANQMPSMAWILRRVTTTEQDFFKQLEAGGTPAAAAPEPEPEPTSGVLKPSDAEHVKVLVAALRERQDFLVQKASAGPEPSTQQLAQFMRKTTDILVDPLLNCPTWAQELVQDGFFEKLGWVRKTNTSAPGSAPPTLEKIKKCVGETVDSVEMLAN